MIRRVGDEARGGIVEALGLSTVDTTDFENQSQEDAVTGRLRYLLRRAYENEKCAFQHKDPVAKSGRVEQDVNEDD